MTIKVHGNPRSTATQRVLVALYEKHLEFEFVPIDMGAGGHKQPSYLALNPFGQVPALEDGEIKLFESRAITKYLAYTHDHQNEGTSLIHKEKHEMAAQLVWEEVEAHQFDPVASKLAWELVFKGIFGMQTDTTVVEENEAKLAKVLDVYEARLTESEYLGANDSFTLVDLHHLPLLGYLMGTQVKKLFEERAHVSAWCKKILARPSWEKTLALQKQS
nr:glutathione S-transferase [Silene vulgaris]